MCVIIGIVGSKPALPLPIDRLQRLEYHVHVSGNPQKAAARGCWVILSTDAPGRDAMGKGIVGVIELPTVNHFLASVLSPLPAQLPADHARPSKLPTWIGPGNLASSVTVEQAR
jgi:glucosamine 6-phosphate synthetase-like amidotransferase/phosphosugar isomerase protein